MRRTLTALTVLALSACSSSPPPRAPGTALTATWWATPNPAAVARLAREVEPLRQAPACLGQRLGAVPDLAHAWWLGADAPTRDALAQALALAGDPLYAASVSAQRAQPEGHAEASDLLGRAVGVLTIDPAEAQSLAAEAAEAFAGLGDRLLETEARLLEVAAALDQDQALPLPLGLAQARAQRAQVAVLAIALRPGAPCDSAVTAADDVGHGAALATLETWIQRARLAAPRDPSALPLARYRVASRRNEPERALLEADQALQVAKGERQLEARLAVAQARAAMGQPTAGALDAGAVAEQAVAAGQTPLEARAEAQLGSCLLSAGRPEEAAQAYGRAEAAYARAGDAPGRIRARLNQITALLAVGDVPGARAALDAPGPAPADDALAARRAIVACLVGLLEGELTAPTAADQVEGALSRARAAGAYAVLLRYGDLPERLRSAGGS